MEYMRWFERMRRLGSTSLIMGSNQVSCISDELDVEDVSHHEEGKHITH